MLSVQNECERRVSTGPQIHNRWCHCTHVLRGKCFSYSDNLFVSNLCFQYCFFFNRQLLSAQLYQKIENDRGLHGFLTEDIKTEAHRGSQLVSVNACCWFLSLSNFLFCWDIYFQKCFYCKKKGATIGCCRAKPRSCKRSFHLPCALKENCTFSFSEGFQSFCHSHAAVELSSIYEPKTACKICKNEMGEYNIAQSIESSCCRSWYHKLCVAKEAHSIGFALKCFSCDDGTEFQENMLSKGIYIPDK